MTLNPDYPRMMFHSTKDWVIVKSAAEEEALGPEWSRTIPGGPPQEEPKPPPPKQTKAKRDAKGRYVDTSH
jgi:hypothetical protein